jgi:hypothetical protein
MAFVPKLEVFKIRLVSDGNSTFKNLFHTDANQSAKDIMFLILKKLFKELDSKQYHRNEKTKKALTSRNGHGEYKMIEIDPDRNVIYGKIEGGPFGIEKIKSDINDREIRDPVKKNNVITVEFFFLLYTPLRSNTAILMVQSYSSESITNLLVNLIRNLFQSKQRKFKRAKGERYVPECIKQDFREKAAIKKLKFSTDYVIGYLTEDGNDVETRQEEFVISIEAESKNEIEKDNLQKLLELFRNGILQIGRNPKELKDFTKPSKGTLKNMETNHSSPFVIGTNFDIKPAIYLGEKISTNDGIPDWKELEKYCFALLPEIVKEVYPNYKINEV